MLTAELAVGELDVVWGFHVGVGEGEGLVVPCEICVLVPRAQVAYLGFTRVFFQQPLDQTVIFRCLKHNRYRRGQLNLRLPSINNPKSYPITISGLREYFLSVIS